MSKQNEIISSCLQLSRTIIANRNKILAPLGLTSAQAGLLIYIMRKSKEQEITVADMVEHFSLTHQTISGIISRLIEKNFIEKVKSEKDSRCYIIHLTTEGLKIKEMLHAHSLKSQNQMLATFSDSEIEQFLHYLKRASANLD